MLKAILEGVLIGLSLAIMVGPYFLFLVNTSLTKGKVSANFLAFGVALSDLLFLCISALTMSWFLKNSAFTKDYSWTAAIFILAFGIYTITKKPSKGIKKSLITNPKQKLQNSVKGFVLIA